MRHRLEYGLVRTVQVLVRPWPIAALRVAGGWLGLVAYVLDARHRRIAMANLQAAFPSRSPRELRRIARGVFRHMGALLLEVLKLDGMPASEMLPLFDGDGEERIREAYRQGRGVLLVTGHFGYWEMLNLGQALRVAPFSYVQRPLDNPLLDRMLEGVRTQTGNTGIARQGGVRRMLRELAANRGVGMLIDQHLHGPDAVRVQFFGRPAATTSALAALALRTGAAVIPFFALPAPGGRYRFVVEHAVPPPEGDGPEAVREFTQRCTDVIEMYVRRSRAGGGGAPRGGGTAAPPPDPPARAGRGEAGTAG